MIYQFVKNRARFATYLVAAIMGLTIQLNANNVSITNTSVSGNEVRFNISWDNSWRVSQPPYSYDAVWVFIKYAECTGSAQVWKHATLHVDEAQDSTGAGLEIKTSLNSDGNCYGVFIQRSDANIGGPSSIASTQVRLTFAAGVPPPGPTYNFRVYGIEMVYTPGGDFDLGDGASFNSFSSVTSNAALEIVGAADAAAAIGGVGTTTNALPAAYPTGWNAIYCMKYEVSQQEYVNFLNVLTYDQQESRTDAPPNTPPNPAQAYALGSANPYQTQANRNGIRILTPGTNNTIPAIYACDLGDNGTFNDNDDGQNVACNWLSWADLSAYLDWAALRPMTEMEYEKEVRGTATRVGLARASGQVPLTSNCCCRWTCNGFAPTAAYLTASSGNQEPFYRYTAACVLTNYSFTEDGAATIRAANSGSLVNSGLNNEISTLSGNGLYALGGNPVTQGPLRVGFAATATTNRISAGAGFYGVLDLTGNVWEHTVSTDASGVLFSETAQGNGELDASGLADVATWPAPATALGTGRRGGAWDTPLRYTCGAGNEVTPTATWYFMTKYPLAEISNRIYATDVNATRVRSYGGRGVRNP